MKQIETDLTISRPSVPANGQIQYPMKNDYMFRAVLQTNETVLKNLISALLHLKLSDIISADIKNPIELGKQVDEKEFFLDIKVCLNNCTIINLEMQVLNEGNWPERSLSYLCRTFDNLTRGIEYEEVKTAIHIGFLSFTLFKDYPEFYATYKLQNIKNEHIYTDKFQLSVVDLTNISLATEEDRKYQIDYWAALFKATTWEEIKVLAEKNPAIKEASETMYQLSKEEEIKLRCEAREDYYRRQKRTERIEAEYKAAKAETANIKVLLAEKDAEIAKLKAELEAKAQK